MSRKGLLGFGPAGFRYYLSRYGWNQISLGWRIVIVDLAMLGLILVFGALQWWLEQKTA